MKIIFPLLIFVLIISACKSEKSKKKIEAREFREQREKAEEQIKDIEINKLVSKYQIDYMWDTLSYRYSVKYKPVINSGFQLVDGFSVHDIFENDSILYASIKTGSYPSFYFEFPISREQQDKLLDNDHEILLVISVNSIQKIRFEMNAESEDSESSYLNIDYSDDYFGKGKLVDVVFVSTIKEN
jgi:hypothetical protein